jgi:hypothetical protein
MTCKHRARLDRRLALPISLLLFLGCGPSNGSAGTGGSSGTSGSGGGSGSGSPGGTNGGGSGGGAGTGGASGSGGPRDGGIDGGGSGGSGGSGSGGSGGSGAAGIDGGGSGGGSGAAGSTCPTMPVPGNCAPPVDIQCPYPKLSQTGCIAAMPFSDSKIPLKMASVVVPYEVNSPLWSDGALKTRGMRLPAGGKIHVKDCAKNPMECCVPDMSGVGTGCLPPADDGKWVFPVGTVLVKNFFFPDASRPSGYKLVETRLLVRMDKVVLVQGVKTEWVGYGYQWDDTQTDATIIGTLVDGSDIGVSAMFNVTPMKGAAPKSIKWDYPSRIDCLTCHMPITPATTPTSGYSIGPETVQLNRIATGDTMNQIDKFAALSMFETAPAKPYKAALVAPYPGQSGSPPASATVDEMARSYLHANCAFCHRPDGKWSGFDIRYDVPLKSVGICNELPGKGDLGVAGAKLLAPKSPMTSLMWLRMHAPVGNDVTGATGRMPAIGSSVVDTQGTDLISLWINSINACPN